MKHWNSKLFPAMLAMVMLIGGAAVWAQEGDRPDRGNRGDRGPRGQQVDREQMRERMSQHMQQRLDVSEEEWAAIEPLVQNVQTLQSQGGWRGMGGMRGFRGPRDGGDDQNLPPVIQAHRDLQQTLRDENASEADIQQSLETLRSAREQHEQQLEEAREELREVLTSRQEAQLVLMGLLD